MIHSQQDIVVSNAANVHNLHLGDDGCIDVTQLHNVDYWTETLGVSEVELRIAVAAVGDSARDVRDHLGK
ncbi:hypothetical protein VARIO8X_150193 [Burkholderiales bacterium 8X]|nr:hypothetical protein VARIO8X_150193 [Burkholderiales bacterium 8X]